jgi:hypothetical protein
VDDIRVIEAAYHMYDGIYGAYIAEKLVAEAFALAGTFDQASYINELYRSRDDFLRVDQFFELIEALIRHYDHTCIRLYGAEREIGSLCLAGADRVKEC